MKKLIFDEGLLLTDMELTYKGKSIHLQRVLVDTGSATTIICSDYAEEIGIVAEENDPIYRICGVGGSELVFSKTIDGIKIGNMTAKSFPIEVGAMDYDYQLDGIIGLNLLKELKAMINMGDLSLKIENSTLSS
ncbi:clan AA aspartic protease [Ureibacillus sp. Re31]|uniref:Clan AA aspartic protease n=1 Tax=Ureibacillus galli TaxID=2762222 RepID=A0ABR8XGV3_9BACL|nr:retropepsin-like aspartic protease [Ureibacillus galli]MBD8028445.1 clan AA aspartic protease [Ureibacillus galli]